jgi:hypothetical protein
MSDGLFALIGDYFLGIGIQKLLKEIQFNFPKIYFRDPICAGFV